MKLLLINKKSKQKHSWDCEISQEHPTTTVDFQQLAAPRKNTQQKSGIPKMGHILIKCTFSKPHHFWGPPAFSLRGFRKKIQQIFRSKSISDSPTRTRTFSFSSTVSASESSSLGLGGRPNQREKFCESVASEPQTPEEVGLLDFDFRGISSCFPMFFFTALKCC